MCPEERRICKALDETSLGDHNSSQGLLPISVLMAMERNCTFNPLSWKLGRMKDSLNQVIPITIREIMAGANKHAATDKTKDQEKVGKGQGGSGQNHNQIQHQNQNHGDEAAV